MCGICGAVNLKERRVSEAHVQAMTSILRHRGPDSSGIVSNGNVILGHTRLSIIDLSGGYQPMESSDGRYYIAFNGEIFNYIELKEELETLGNSFSTNSDTEVIIESYRTWGPKAFSKFNGQWAFALWDRKEGMVILSRDRVGIRPLFYTKTATSLLFASEIKALFCHPDVNRQFDPEGLSQSYTFWAPVAPKTVFSDVHQLPPGHYAVIDVRKGSMDINQYWDLSFGKNSSIRAGSLDENKRQFRNKLIDAVKLRFDRSDVPVGAYLSGGIDSTVTTAVISEYTDVPIKTFSVAFSDSEFDESQYQDLVAGKLGTDHERIIVDASDIGEIFPDVVWHGEQPILRTAPGPLFMLSGLVRESDFKVVVTGEGSDEMLAGYDIFRETMVRRLVADNPERDDLEDLVMMLYPWMHRSPAKTPAFAKAFFGQSSDKKDTGFSHRPRWNTSANILQFINSEFAAPSGEYTANTYLNTLPESFLSWSPLEQAQYIEIKTLLSGYILAPQGDRMLMGHSVEGRFPFLDHNIMEFAASLPPEQKLNDFEEKYILKEAFSDLIPKEVATRPKQPYRAPDASSFFHEGAGCEWLHDVLSESSVTKAGIFNEKMVAGLKRKCTAKAGLGMSNTDNMRIVAIVSTMLLQNRFIDNTYEFNRAMKEGKDIPVITVGRGA